MKELSQLVEAAQAGDREAYAALVQRTGVSDSMLSRGLTHRRMQGL